MRKFTSLMTVLLIAATTVAQNLNFTFTRGDANAATVTVSGDAGEGVTATLVASGNWLTNGAMANATDVLCVNQNTNTGATITYTLTVSGLDNSHVFSYLSHTHKAVNSGGNYQPANDYDVRPRNFVITANDSEIATKTKEGIWIPSGQSSKTIEYQTNEFSAVDGELKITISLYSPNETDEEKKGCFFGLTGVTISGNPYQVELESLIAEYEAISFPVGTNPGEYTEAAVAEFNDAIATAKDVTAATQSDIDALVAAYNNMAVTMNPVVAGTYMIVSAASTFGENTKAISCYTYDTYHSAHSTPAWAPIDENNPLQYWTLEDAGNGTFNIKAAYEGNYITTATSMSATAAAASFESLGSAQFKINLGGVLHCNGWNWAGAGVSGPLTTWDGVADSPSAWKLVKVETPSFSHTLTVSEAGYATLMLAFDAEIPAGVECYYATATEGDVLKLAQVEGNVLPANTPVIVKAAAGNYDFTSTDATATAPEGNLLSGTLYTKNVTPAGTAYVLSAPAGKVGLYQAELANNGTFQNNANKVYFDAPAAAEIASYSFNFDWAGTTAIEGVVAEGAQDGATYDITGRRVKAITAPGIYIVNGRKVVK